MLNTEVCATISVFWLANGVLTYFFFFFFGEGPMGLAFFSADEAWNLRKHALVSRLLHPLVAAARFGAAYYSFGSGFSTPQPIPSRRDRFNLHPRPGVRVRAIGLGALLMMTLLARHTDRLHSTLLFRRRRVPSSISFSEPPLLICIYLTPASKLP